MESVYDIMTGAIVRKETIGILYHGGSNPGAYREILPLRITLKGKLQAKCLLTNSVKLFVLENIELAATPERDSPELSNGAPALLKGP